MKKILVLTVVLLAMLFAFVGCSLDKADGENNQTTSDVLNNDLISEPTSENSDENVQNNQNQQSIVNSDNANNQQNNGENGNNSTSSSSGNSLISDEDIEKLQQSNAEVYFSDNPNNKYIVRVVEKYGVDPSNLVALVKVNATFPSAMVLEFSGKRDANDELIMTYSELKYVYNIDESDNTLVKASKSGVGNDGVSFVESKMLFFLMDKYFCPELPNLRANKRYD